MSRRTPTLITSLKSKVPKNASLLIAVSGGKDSVALLDSLHSLQRLLNLKLEVAHVNHNLRPESDEDAKFVAELADKYRLEFHQRSLTPPTKSINLENWGRTERYRYFKSLLKDRKLDLIATAHHSDDLAETFLMRLTSNKELRGIRALSKKQQVIRPLLSISKKEIEKYIIKRGLSFREDRSNIENKFLRNKVRNTLLPMLKENFHPQVSRWIAERARASDRDARCLDKLAKQALREIASEEIGSTRFQAVLRRQPVSIGTRMLEFYFLPKLKYRLGFARAKVVREVVLGKMSACNLPNGLTISWKRKKLEIYYGLDS